MELSWDGCEKAGTEEWTVRMQSMPPSYSYMSPTGRQQDGMMHVIIVVNRREARDERIHANHHRHTTIKR